MPTLPSHPGSLLPLALVVASALCATAYGQGHAPEEAVGRMTVEPGFEVQLFAAEPMVRQPVAIEFDDRGRLWVIQYLQYPNPAGLERVKVDRYSRTTYDRIPDPPPRGPRGADRITILHDTNGDGRADQAKDFVSGLNLATGLAFGHGGVFVLNVPYLLFYPDRNRDDVPDADPEVLLQGFGMEDASSVANSLAWGPDGWLYGTQGTTVTADIRGIEFQQGVWRYHPLTKRFELFCEGGGNSWGLDFDRHGNLLYSTNVGGYLMTHGLPGAYYWKQFGKHGALHNPYTFGYFEHVPHEGFRGGHVTVGGTVYQGMSFPERFRETFIGGDVLGHGVYWHTMTPDGSTFRSKHAGQLLEANDTWFAPTDVTMGPDGAIYLTDWHDQRTAHPDPDAPWDRSNGRIYRIQAAGAKQPAHVDLNDVRTEKLVDWLSHANGWYVRGARRLLAERRDAGAAVLLGKLARETQDDRLALEALWACYVSGGYDQAIDPALFKHRNENVRRWAVRLVGERAEASPDRLKLLMQMAASDPSPPVRAELASTAKRLPADAGLEIVERLILRDEDVNDPFIPLLLWWAVEEHAVKAAEPVLDWFASPRAWKAPLARDFILDRLTKRYAAEGTESGLSACARLLASAPSAADRRRLIVALDEGLRLIGSDKAPHAAEETLLEKFAASGSSGGEGKDLPPVASPALSAMVEQYWREQPTDATLTRLAIRLGSRKAHDRAVALATGAGTAPETRQAMLAVLGELGRPSCVPAMVQLVAGPDAEPVKLAALQVLDRFPDPRIPERLLAEYPRWGSPLRAAARDLLFRRQPWAAMFLEGVADGKFPAQEVPLDQLRPLAVYQDERIDALVRGLWGGIRAGTPEEKLAEVRRLNNDLRAGHGDADRGRELFTKHCATCHRLFDAGNHVGPDLTHANRTDRNYLLVSIVDPAAQIRKEFLSYVVQTDDGRVLTGLVADQTPASLTLVSEKNEKYTVPRGEIESMKESSVSLMPENILKQFTADQVRDLFRYLETPPPAPN